MDTHKLNLIEQLRAVHARQRKSIHQLLADNAHQVNLIEELRAANVRYAKDLEQLRNQREAFRTEAARLRIELAHVHNRVDEVTAQCDDLNRNLSEAPLMMNRLRGDERSTAQPHVGIRKARSAMPFTANVKEEDTVGNSSHPRVSRTYTTTYDPSLSTPLRRARHLGRAPSIKPRFGPRKPSVKLPSIE